MPKILWIANSNSLNLDTLVAPKIIEILGAEWARTYLENILSFIASCGAISIGSPSSSLLWATEKEPGTLDRCFWTVWISVITVGHRNEFRIAPTFQTIINVVVSFSRSPRGLLSFSHIVFTMVDQTEKQIKSITKSWKILCCFFLFWARSLLCTMFDFTSFLSHFFKLNFS